LNLQTAIVRPENRVFTFPEKVVSESLTEAVASQMCRRSFLVFQKVELGMDIGEHHKAWWGALRTRIDCVFLSPRDHGKSLSMARAYSIWRAKYDRWTRDILVLGVDQASAAENLEKVKELMTNHQTLRYLIPTDKKAYFNSKTAIKLSNGVVMRARGFGSPLRGRHPQLIIMDDVLAESNSRTKVLRMTTKKRFYEMVVPMRDRGNARMRADGYSPQIVVSGTAQDRDDLYHELLRNPNFEGMKQRAVINETTEEVLWPDRYPFDALMKIKDTVGAVSFSKEYQNEPLSDETSIFPSTLFEPLKDETLSYEVTYDGDEGEAFLGADFSVPGDKKGDWTVYTVLSKDPKGVITLRGYWRARPKTITEQLEKLVEMSKNYNIASGMLEANMFQKIYALYFKDNTSIPLKGVTVTKVGKNSPTRGVLAIRTLLENGKFRFPYKTARDKVLTDGIILEFNGVEIRNGKIGNEIYHDDSVMSIWHAWTSAEEVQFAASFG